MALSIAIIFSNSHHERCFYTYFLLIFLSPSFIPRSQHIALFSTDSPRSRGRGRGPNTPRGRGAPSSPSTPSHQNNQNSNRNQNQNLPSRGRGRGRGDFIPNDPRGGRGGRGGKSTGKHGPLSEQLYQERPFLRPITFIKSQLTPRLFMDEEEIFEPVVEAAGTFNSAQAIITFQSIDIPSCPILSNHHITRLQPSELSLVG